MIGLGRLSISLLKAGLNDVLSFMICLRGNYLLGDTWIEHIVLKYQQPLRFLCIWINELIWNTLSCAQCRRFKGLNIIIISAETQMEETPSRYDKWIRWAMCNNREWCGLWWTKGIGDTGLQQPIFRKIGGPVLWEIFSLRKSELCIFYMQFRNSFMEGHHCQTYRPAGWLQPVSLQFATPA